MTADIHTCSYQCDRPACIRAQRDDLAARAEETAAEIGRLRGELEQARNSCQAMVHQSYKDGFADGIAPAEAKGEAVAWRNPTPYGVGYSFASEEVMRDMVGYVAESFDAPQPPAGEAVAEWRQSPYGDYPSLSWLANYKARVGDKLYLHPPTPPAAQEQAEDFVHGEYIRGYSDAVKAAQVQQEADAAWRDCYGAVIRALAAAVNVNTPDNLFDIDAIPRDPIMEQVARVREAMDRYSKAKSAYPAADALGAVREPGAVRALVAAANSVLADNPHDDGMWTLEAAVRPFNAKKPDECAMGCPDKQVCDYCQVAALAQAPAVRGDAQ